MTRSRTVRRLVTRVEPSPVGDAPTMPGSGSGSSPMPRPVRQLSARRRPDELVVEEPLSIQLDGTLVATTMRTPGNDYELAAGFCITDGLLAGAPITGIRYCADAAAVETAFNVVTVETGGRAPTPVPRLGAVSSSCGWCGADRLDELAGRLGPLPPHEPFALAVLGRIAERVLDEQPLFAATGSIHAAAAFDRGGTPVVVREDVGRHNAVDKVVGHLALSAPPALPVDDLALFVSGRASIEMVQKAWAAGFHTVFGVSAPTALAVEAAARSGITLAGFLRDGAFNVYC